MNPSSFQCHDSIGTSKSHQKLQISKSSSIQSNLHYLINIIEFTRWNLCVIQIYKAIYIWYLAQGQLQKSIYIIFVWDTVGSVLCTRPVLEAISISVTMAISVMMTKTAIAAMTTTIVKRVLTVVKNCNCHKRHNSHTFIRVIMNISLIRINGSTIF